MAKNRSKNNFNSLNTTADGTIRGSEIRSRKLHTDFENEIDESTIIDPNSRSKSKKFILKRKKLTPDDLDSDVFQSSQNEDVHQSISSRNRMRNTSSVDVSFVARDNLNNEIPLLKNKRNLILDDNDLVIIQTPIKANQLKLDKAICSSCRNQLNKVFSDLRLYARALQSLITLFILGLIAINIFLAYCNCDEKLSKTEYFCLKKCNLSIMAVSFMIVNILTALVFNYDNYQFKQGGYRPNSFFLMFLVWSGGWIILWPIFISKKNQTFIDYKISSFIMSLLSITGPAFYLVIRSLF